MKQSFEQSRRECLPPPPDRQGVAGSCGMVVQQAYKTELDLNDRQVTACRLHAGGARWAYNWGLQVKQERYRAAKKRLSAIALHQVTTRLAKTKSVLVIEDLNVRGMLKNHRMAQAIGDVGFYEFKRQLLYKARWYGARVVLVDRWEPSSKRCSRCGWLDADLTLETRTFHCAQCGLVLDRDLNAAINLEQLAGSSSDSQNACGVVSAGTKHKPRVQLAAKKQELNTL